MPVNVTHLGAIVDTAHGHSTSAQKIDKRGDERARVDEQTANAHTPLRRTDAPCDFAVDFQSAAGREQDARGCRLACKHQLHRVGLYVARVVEILFFPKLLEILRVKTGERGRIDLEHVVFH
ncbi:MAG: hypothetical protein DME49_10960 [Verrucomicrobia bacterium]|nr:MAG: hypothetical protein DME49_10960 [Verrucomicrobiota bacterium]PYL55987.1 MAG: hypothetical protein DMF30_11225 [Verrucomicrobiota bacterium]